MIDYVRSIYRYRGFIRFVAKRWRGGNIYKTIVGRGWLIITPLANMLIYYFLIAIVFQRGDMAGVHPFLMIMTGIVHYLFFHQSLNRACSAILNNESLLMQLSVDPIVFVAATAYQQVQDFLIVLFLYLVFYLWLGPGLTANVLWYPLCLLGLLLLIWSWSVIIASLTVFLRDLEQLLSITLRMLMYLSPVVYTIEFVPEQQWGLPLRELYLYNPVACLFALLQWSLLGVSMPSAGPIVVLVAFIIASFWGGQLIYRRAKPKFTKAF